MSNPYFSFKQFTVWHDQCAMKVGTDGVLLGTWANVSDAKTILDIGTGTGLMALIAAQRNSEANITGIDIDFAATEQAAENVKKSPWKDRIKIELDDVRKFRPEKSFDAILCNPPYFQNSLKCPDQQRAIARHTDALSLDELLGCVRKLINDNGEFSVILPCIEGKELENLAFIHSLYTARRTYVHTTSESAPKRILLSFKKTQVPVVEKHLTIGRDKSSYSEEFKNMVAEFYL